MSVRILSRFFTALLLSSFAGTNPVAAHLIGAGGAGFGQGLAHPFSGLDHDLAMVAVGLWAAQVGGRAIWVLPVTFPAVMAVGAILGCAGMPLPATEIGIALSAICLGACVALALKPSLVPAAAIIGLFALLHGHAHGTELPEAAQPLLYGSGFVLATLTLHVAGIGLGLAFNRCNRANWLRIGGSGIAAAGVVLLLQIT